MSALIPNDSGARLAVWTCPVGDGCTGECCLTHKRDLTFWHGSPESAAEAHAAADGGARVHVVDSGRGHTFKVWRSHRGLESREVL